MHLLTYRMDIHTVGFSSVLFSYSSVSSADSVAVGLWVLGGGGRVAPKLKMKIDKVISKQLLRAK